jgi:DNA-binding transcriptional LysR family regulator
LFAKVGETGSFWPSRDRSVLLEGNRFQGRHPAGARLGASLFHRTSRRLALSELGRAAAVNAAASRPKASAEAEATAQSTTPRGLVRLAAPTSFGLAHVAPILPAFLEAYPEVAIDLHLSDALVDLVGGGFDLALRIAALADSSLRARRLCRVRRLLVGSPAYLDRKGGPVHPRDLAGHACLGYAYLPTPDRWTFVHVSGEEATVTPIGSPRRIWTGACSPGSPAIVSTSSARFSVLSAFQRHEPGLGERDPAAP